MTDGTESDRTATAAGVAAVYRETESERILEFGPEPHASAGATDVDSAPTADAAAEDRTAAIAQNREGYAMLAVRLDGEELERYYGFDVALDHVGELLGVASHELPVPEAANDMGM